MAKVSLRAYNREIEQLIDRGQVDQAIGHCRHILQTFPKYLEIYRLLGKAYLESKQYNEAVDIFQRLLMSVPNDFVAHVGMSIIRDEETKLDEAIWHMERAFETQPSNAAIQGELQRLYGRRDGMQPPRIRMTRGALAHMYVQGELYPQAISEIRGVLKEDPNRAEMQTLLARAAFKSGQKNDAAEVASQIIRKYPYNFDANRVLVEILSAGDKAESAQTYRQRVVELDPYAGQVAGSIFLSNEVSDAAVNLERWNGEGATASWDSSSGIALPPETPATREAQPDWLNSGFDQPAPRPSASPAPKPAPVISTPRPPMPPPAIPTPQEEIPDFLRAAGWGQSTGAFDESKPAFADEPAATTGAIEQGDMPDWVKAMKPVETQQPPVSAVPVPVEPASDGDMPDWLNQLEAQAKSAPVSTDIPDWLKPSSTEPAPEAPASEQPDWLSQLGSEATPASAAVSDDLDWLKNMDEPKQPTVPASIPPARDTGDLGKSDQERDDSFSWLENLAAKQGASEGLLTKPEDRMEKEPDWVAQAKNLGASQPPVQTPPPALQPMGNLEELGKSDQERDDSFSWLENLAAKQGASEGLLTKPEDRMEKEPDWVAQAKNLGASQPPVQAPPPAPQPMGSLEELGKSDQERDDSFSWLENLAAKQGASEGLLTKPEDRMEKEPDWVAQAKDLSATQIPVPAQPTPVTPAADETASWLRSFEQPSEEAVAEDETAVWLKKLDEFVEPKQPGEPVGTQSTDWLHGFEDEKQTEDLFSAYGVPPTAEPTKLEAIQQPVAREEEKTVTDWLHSLDQTEPAQQPASPQPATQENLPAWLDGLDKEKTPSVPASLDDLPPWLRDETGEVVAEPPKIQPTRPADWRPADELLPQEEKPKPAPAKQEKQKKVKEHAPSESAPQAQIPMPEYKEPATIKRTGTPAMTVDPVLGQARADLSRSNIPGALEAYSRLVKKGRFLDEVIFDLREALYRYPVEVSIWQALGDAYMRANRLQDALDAYTKAEELLR